MSSEELSDYHFSEAKLNTMDHQLISINNLVKKKFYSEIHVSGIINVKYYKFFFIFMNQ